MREIDDQEVFNRLQYAWAEWNYYNQREGWHSMCRLVIELGDRIDGQQEESPTADAPLC